MLILVDSFALDMNWRRLQHMHGSVMMTWYANLWRNSKMMTTAIQAVADRPATAYSVYLREKVFANRDGIKRLMDDYGACNVRICGSVACGTAN